MRRLAAYWPFLVIAGLTLLFFYKLAFTDLILARGDTFAYFYPYWQVRNAALMRGHFPLWSPDLFMGVPLLANSQIGAFYPPNWLTAPLSAPQAIRLSLLAHIFWALAGAYLLARRTMNVDKLPALLAAALFGVGGYLSAQVEHINQLQGLSWMPWLFLLLDLSVYRSWRYTPLLAMGLALQFLSGHTQTVFITGVGLGLYALLTRRIRALALLAAAGIAALPLAAPQLIPTSEMMGVSNRRGGLNPNQATAFSFSPFALGRGLLPSFDTLIFTEYVAYVGVIGLGMAIIGALTPHSSSQHSAVSNQLEREPGAEEKTQSSPERSSDVLNPHPNEVRTSSVLSAVSKFFRRLFNGQSPSPRVIWLVIGLIGLALAFGAYNPVYWTLATLPGFNLFRVPARWLALFALGLAMLAGLGAQALGDATRRLGWPALARLVLVIVALVAVLAKASTFATQMPEQVPVSDPTTTTQLAWFAALAVLVAALVAREWLVQKSPDKAAVRVISPLASEATRRERGLGGEGFQIALRSILVRSILPLLVAASVVELFLASRAMPFNDLAPGDSYSSQRFTDSQILAYNQSQTPPARVLSISGLLFDPGDRTALEARYHALGLSPAAISTAFDAVKMKETLAANLPLAWGIPSVDGFDGGLLPTEYYTSFTSMLLPPGQLRTIDGRLREILAQPSCRGACLPDQRWLNLMNVGYLITDKVYDLVDDGIFYDTEFEVNLAAGASSAIASLPPFESNAVDVLYTPADGCADPPQCAPAVTLTYADGTTETLPAAQTSTTLDSFQLVRLPMAEARTPVEIHLAAATDVRVRAVSLVDSRTGDFAQATLGQWRRLLSSDIKLYGNLTVQTRAFVVQNVQTMPDSDIGTEGSLAVLRDPSFDPTKTVILYGNPEAPTAMPSSSAQPPESSAVFEGYMSERVALSVDTPAAGYLVLTDAYYPGWTVTVNGQPATLRRADVMFRAVRVAAGHSEVVFQYQPAWWPWAGIVGGLAWFAALGALAIFWRRLD